MVESYRFKSKVATAVSFLAAFIVYIGKDELATVLPQEWAYLAPIIVLFAGYIATQSTENKRVDVAEQLVHEEYENAESNNNNIDDDGIVDDEGFGDDEVEE